MSLARKTDPITSHMAADRTETFIGGHKQRILNSLDVLKQATPHELELVTGLTVVQLDRRLCELKSAGLVRVVTENGAIAIRGGARVWELNR